MRAIEIQDLAIGYQTAKKTSKLQWDMNLQVDKGQMVSIIGQNGVGKTTLIKTIMGLIPALKGKILLSGKTFNDIGFEEMSRMISVVLTEKAFATNLSVWELVSMGRHPYSNWLGLLSKEDREMVEWAITETQINYIAEKRLGELSDGQLQKALIARALAQDTEIVILDEPTAHLDLNNRIEIYQLLRTITDQGKSVLISTHEIQISSQLSDRLWLFNFNEPVVDGKPGELIKSGKVHHALNLDPDRYDLISGKLLKKEPLGERGS